jgi:hypothetical protein
MPRSVDIVRIFIREEIAHLMRGESVNSYPWKHEEPEYSITSDHEGCFVITVGEGDDSVTKKFDSEEEARFWARSVIDSVQRAALSREK